MRDTKAFGPTWCFAMKCYLLSDPSDQWHPISKTNGWQQWWNHVLLLYSKIHKLASLKFTCSWTSSFQRALTMWIYESHEKNQLNDIYILSWLYQEIACQQNTYETLKMVSVSYMNLSISRTFWGMPSWSDYNTNNTIIYKQNFDEILKLLKILSIIFLTMAIPNIISFNQSHQVSLSFLNQIASDL